MLYKTSKPAILFAGFDVFSKLRKLTLRKCYLNSGPTVLGEYDGSGNLQAEYIYGLRGMVAQLDPSKGYLWLFTDHLGSTRHVDNSAMQRDYYPYGEVYDAAGNDDVPYQFTGKEFDTGVGLHYFGARYYDARIGRWLVSDPARQYFSPYVYVGNRPLSFIDPNGEFAWLAAFFFAGAAMYTAQSKGYGPGSWQFWAAGALGFVGGGILGSAIGIQNPATGIDIQINGFTIANVGAKQTAAAGLGGLGGAGISVASERFGNDPHSASPPDDINSSGSVGYGSGSGSYGGLLGGVSDVTLSFSISIYPGGASGQLENPSGAVSSLYGNVGYGFYSVARAFLDNEHWKRSKPGIYGRSTRIQVLHRAGSGLRGVRRWIPIRRYFGDVFRRAGAVGSIINTGATYFETGDIYAAARAGGVGFLAGGTGAWSGALIGTAIGGPFGTVVGFGVGLSASYVSEYWLNRAIDKYGVDYWRR